MVKESATIIHDLPAGGDDHPASWEHSVSVALGAAGKVHFLRNGRIQFQTGSRMISSRTSSCREPVSRAESYGWPQRPPFPADTRRRAHDLFRGHRCGGPSGPCTLATSRRIRGSGWGYVIDHRRLPGPKDLARGTGAVADRSADEALADKTVDVVIIGSSTSAHEEHVLACAAGRGSRLSARSRCRTIFRAAIACMEAAARAGVVGRDGSQSAARRRHAETSAGRVHGGEIGVVESMHVVSRSASPPAPESVPLLRRDDPREGERTSTTSRAGSRAPSRSRSTRPEGASSIPVSGTSGTSTPPPWWSASRAGALATFQFGRRTTYGQDELLEVSSAPTGC